MYIFNQAKDAVVNSNNITRFSVSLEAVEIRDQEKPWILTADDYTLGEFPTKKDAIGVMDTIISLLANGMNPTYNVE